MAPIEYAFQPTLQPTNATCTQASTAMLVSHFNPSFDVERIYKDAPVYTDDNGEELGSSLIEVAAWSAKQGFKVKAWAFDSMLLDLTWRNLSTPEVVERLKAVRETRDIETLGKALTERYIDDYLELIKAGGELVIQPYVSSELLDELIKAGPFCAGVNYPTLKGSGHAKNTGTRESVPDDTNNGIATHAVLVYGKNENGEFMLADPWGKPLKYAVEADQLISAIMAAQWFCDNVIFAIQKDEALN